MLRDATTGIFTRASFAGRLRQEVSRARLQGQPVSLLLIDIDYFKSVNDAFGHGRGDEVLLEWTSRLRATLRGNDLPFRYGGDEFVVVLPGAAKSEASVLAHRLLSETSARPFGEQPSLNLSVSVGAASFPDDADSPDELFRQADLRLMEAKRRGRGRVVEGAATECDSLAIDSAPSRLVGRDEAMQGLLGFLGRLIERGRGLCTIEGVHGSGRTRFLREAEQSARLRGLTVISVIGSNRRTEPFAALRSVMRRLSPGSHPPAAPEDWLRYLQSQSKSSVGLLVTVDDAEVVDASSLEVIRRMLESPGPGLYGAAAAAEPTQADRITVPFGMLHESLRLPPLGKEALRVWVRGLLHWEPPEALLDWLRRETDGLPSRMMAAVQGLQEKGVLRRDTDTWSLTGELPQVSPVAWAASGATPAAGYLPALLTSFVGRHHEMGEVRRRLDTSRLVTLAGPGGIGKTRLAIEAGSDLSDDYPGGVWLVELASLADGTLIFETIAAALGLSGEAEGTIEATVVAHLQARTLLLVLDNCEHLVEPAARVAERLLLRCPHLSILSTSREPLGISGESVFRVPPLSFPSPTESGAHELDPADIDARFEAIRLFCSRAALTRPAFVLTRENFPAVARICRQLDGIPLALELAAARTNVLPVAQIADRLADRFRLLRGGNRTALPRQQTLKSLIDWSYDLLTSEEKRVLRTLSVFAGGCSSEAAEAVAFEQDGEEIFDVLARLVDKSLIQADLGDLAAGEPRYRLLETIRQYAQDRLIESGESARRRDQHARYYARFAEAAEGQLTGPRQREWLDRLDGELDNLRAALDHCREAHPDLGLGIAGRLVRFWQVRGHITEGREWLSALFASRQRQEPMVDPGPEYLQALLAAGQLAHLKHDSQAAIDYLTAADILAEHLGDAPSRVRALCQLGYPQHESGDQAAATHSWRTGLALSKRLDDAWTRAFALRCWAFHLNMLRQDEAALESLEESLQLFRARGDVWMTAHALWSLGYTRMWRRGDYRTAAAVLREGRELWASLREWMGVSHILAELGWALYFEGDVSGSRQAFEELLARATDRQDSWGLPTALHHLGKLAQLKGDDEAAEGLLRRIFSLDANDWLVANHTPWATQTLGLIEVLHGRESRAREWLWEAIAHFRNRSDELGVAVTIQNLARLKVRSNPEAAAALFAWATAAYVRQGWVLAERLHPENPEDLRSVRSALGERGLLMARSAGVKLSADEALAIALEEGRGLPANLICR